MEYIHRLFRETYIYWLWLLQAVGFRLYIYKQNSKFAQAQIPRKFLVENNVFLMFGTAVS